MSFRRGWASQFAEVSEQQAAEAIASKVHDLMTTQTLQPTDPLANLRILEEAYQNQWLLSSSQLAAILGLKGLPSGESFQRHGFTFRKAGKNGAESAWAITKSST